MMELLVEKLSQSFLPVDQLKEELSVVLPKEKKGYRLSWIEPVKRMFSRAADSASEILFGNICKIIEVKLEETVERVLKNSKRDGHIYCASLNSFISHIQYSVTDTGLPVTEINKLNVHLLSAVIDIESASVRSGEEPAAVSRIFLKLTLMLGHHPEYIIDTLLHCKTLIYASARQPLIYVPLIKRVFTSLKNKSPQSPHLYLKYLLIGKLWLFMTKKEEVGMTRTYIINSVKFPNTFVDWASQNKIPWLKLHRWNSKLILRSMTVSSALRTLYNEYKPPTSQWNVYQNSKKRKKEDDPEVHDHRNEQEEILPKNNKENVLDETKIKVEPEKEVYLLIENMNADMDEVDTVVKEKHETNELVMTHGKNILQDPPRKIKKRKTHDSRESEKELKSGGKKEEMMDSGQIKILKKNYSKSEEKSPGKKKKVIASENSMKLVQFQVLDKKWKCKNIKKVEAKICRENEIDETQVKKGSTSNEVVQKSSTSHGASGMRKYEKMEQLKLKKHKDAVRKRIRRESITFTVTDLNPVVKNLQVECVGGYKKDNRKQGEYKESKHSNAVVEVFDNSGIEDDKNDAVIMCEVKQSTEKLTTVKTISREPDEILETLNKSSLPPAVCVEDSDSDIEILHVEKNTKVKKMGKCKPIGLSHASDIDEASGSDSDIVPCDEKEKMFTDEETKNYHDKLMEAVMQRKVEDILKEEDKELKRKRVEDEKTKNIDHETKSQKAIENNTDKETTEKKAAGCEDLVSQMMNKLYNDHKTKSQKTIENSNVEETTDKKADSCKDLVSEMMNKLYKPSASVKNTEAEEPSDFESDDGDMEVILQTIVKDTGKMASIHGLRERLLNSPVVKDEPDDSEKKPLEIKKGTEVVENHVDCHEKFKERNNKEAEAPDMETFTETKAQEIKGIDDEKLEDFSDKPKNKKEEVHVVEQDDNIKPNEVIVMETEALHNNVNHNEKSPKHEDIGEEIFDNVHNQKDTDNSLFLDCGSLNEMQVETGNGLNVELKNSGNDMQIASIGSLERGSSLDSVSCHSSFEEVDASFLPNTSSLVPEMHEDNKCSSLKQEMDDRSFSLEVCKNEKSGACNFAQSADIGKEKEIESDVSQTVEIKEHPDTKVEVIKEDNNSVIEVVASMRENETVVKPSPIYEAIESEDNHENDKQSSTSEKHLHIDSFVDVHNSENGSSTDVGSPIMERVRVSEDSAEEFQSEESETVSSKRSEIKQSTIVSESISSVAQIGKDLETRNTELDCVTEESEEGSIAGADEDYEASSDASEESIPRICRRTRSLRRSFTGALTQEGFDSDASPEQRTIRIRRISNMSGVVHLGPSQSSCMEKANSVLGASGSVQSSEALFSDSTLESDFSTNRQNVLDAGSNVNASRASLLTTDISDTSNSASSVKLQNTPKKSFSHTPGRRRSARLFEKTVTQQNRLCNDALSGSDSVSGVSLDGRPAEKDKTGVLTRSVRCTKSDSRIILDHDVQLKKKNGKASINPTKFHNVKNCGPREDEENILRIYKEVGYNCNMTPVVEISILENLSSNNLLDMEKNDSCQDMKVIGKLGNQTEHLGKGGTMASDILPSNTPQNGEEEHQELAGKVSKKIQKCQNSGEDYLLTVNVDEKSGSSSGNGKGEDHASAAKGYEENASSEVNEQKKDILEMETLSKDQNMVEEYLDEKEGEELEVLSTSGMLENEDQSSSFSASASPSDSEEHESNMNEKANTPVSHRSLRSLSRRRSHVRCGKKDININIERGDIQPPIPPLKVHCVSEAVLAKEVLISPEVSDEECELVSPGPDNDVVEAESLPLTEHMETTPKLNHSPIIISSHSARKKNGGIRSPQKMIPEEQDETTLLRYKVEGVSRPSQTPRIKSTSILGMQEKVKTKTSCTAGTSDRIMTTRKLSKAKVTDEMPVNKISLVEKSKTTRDLESVAEIIDKASAQSVQNFRSSKHKEVLNGSPVTPDYHATDNDTVHNISSEKSTTCASVNASITNELSVDEESGLRLFSGRKSLDKGLDASIALEDTSINEKVMLINENEKFNEVQPQKEEEKVKQYLKTPNKYPTNLSLNMDGSVQKECSSVSSSELSSPLRRSSRLKKSGQTPSSEIHDISTLIVSPAKEGEPVEFLPEKHNTSPGLAKMDELTSRPGTQMTSGSSQLTMKILLRRKEATVSSSCKKRGSPSESSSRTDQLPAGMSSKKKESKTRLSVKKDEMLTLSSEELDTVAGSSTKNEALSAGKFIRCTKSLCRSSPRLWRRSLDELSSKEKSPYRSSSRKAGSRKRLSLQNSPSTKLLSSLMTQMSLSSAPNSPNKLSCNKNISKEKSSIGMNLPPSRPILNRNESPVRSSPGKINLPVKSSTIKNQSLTKSSDSSSCKNESSARLSSTKSDSPSGSPSPQSKMSLSCSKDESKTRSPLNILSPARLFLNDKSPGRSSKSESPVRSSSNKSPVNKIETQTKTYVTKSKSQTKSTPCKDRSLASNSSSDSEPIKDKGVAAQVGIRSLRHRQVTYSVTLKE